MEFLTSLIWTMNGYTRDTMPAHATDYTAGWYHR